MKRLMGILALVLMTGCATTPLTPDAHSMRVVEWWSGSPNEAEVDTIMDCTAVGRAEKGDDRNALINLGAARGANVVLLKIPKGKSIMIMPTFGTDYDASFFRCSDPVAATKQ